MTQKMDIEDYFAKFGIPWLTGHLQMRNTGLTVFTAIQGALIIGWAGPGGHHWAIPVAALVSCISFYLWDLRVRHVLIELVRMGVELIDTPRFPQECEEGLKRGVFRFIIGTREEMTLRKLCRQGSHTTAIKVLVCGLVALWAILLVV